MIVTRYRLTTCTAIPIPSWPRQPRPTRTQLDALTARVAALGITVIRELPAPALPGASR